MLCAHGGFNFDFKVLLNNMKKYNISLRELHLAELHFALYLRVLQKGELQNVNKRLVFFEFLRNNFVNVC